MKTCTKCGVVKPLSDFFKDNSKKHGYRAICKECSQAAFRAYTQCNQMIGHAKDDPVRLRQAAKYLESVPQVAERIIAAMIEAEA